MIYSRTCPDDDMLLERVEDHVRAHISSCVSPTDSEEDYYSDVVVDHLAQAGTDQVCVRGWIDKTPQAPYIRSPIDHPMRGAGLSLAARIQEQLTQRGIRWRVLDGASNRGNGQTWGTLAGGIMHHTATAYGKAPSVLINGRPDLSGPLCNTAGEEDGTIAFVAYNPANHAGASGGRSMGPLPVTRSFNKIVWGHEIVYPGTAPMTAAQYRSATALAASIAAVVGTGTECIRAHAETSITGKWDPGYASGRTIDMAQFRRDAAGWAGGTDMPLTDADVAKIWNYGVKNAFGGVVPASLILSVTEGRVYELQRKLESGIADAVRDATGRDDQALADAILNKLKERL